MKIVYLAAGAAGMYCGSCLHDNTLAAALLAAGHDVLLVPTYTPLKTDEEDRSERRIFFGGINTYLQDKAALFRHTPWPLDALLDAPGLINFATRWGPGVDPTRLGGLTVSMLEGEQGRVRKEVQKLVAWLTMERPEIVHLSNAMLLGMAREIRKLGLPVVCSLSGEDIFLEKLTEPHYSQARAILRERAAEVEAFVALNQYYADYMSEYLDVPRDRIRVIPHGLKLAGHAPLGARNTVDRPHASRVVGYMARVCHDKGLHLLVEAVEQLNARPGFAPVHLRVAGYLGASDRGYFENIRRQVRSWPDPERFTYLGEIDRADKIAFLQSLDVMSVPTVYRESKGLPAIEALANAVPVVLPAHGTFPEVVADTGGGLLFEPENVAALADRLAELLENPRQAAELGTRGQAAVHDRYDDVTMAKATSALYEQLLGEAHRPGRQPVCKDA